MSMKHNDPEKHIEHSPFPSAEFRFFVFDPMDADFVCFRTAEERDAKVQDIINMYCDEGWDESVEQVCIGEIGGVAQQVNVKLRPAAEDIDEDGIDGEGDYWDGDWDKKCDYQIVPFPYRSSAEEELKAISGMVSMLENGEWAEHAGNGQLSQRLEAAITRLQNALSVAEERTASEAVLSVLAERQRQIQFEGFTPEHDDKYRAGELAAAAGCYALFTDAFPNEGQPPAQWPWPAAWWKPKFYRYDLVHSTALLVAEIERVDRADDKTEAEAAKAGDV